jgi:hypothetical protein
MLASTHMNSISAEPTVSVRPYLLAGDIRGDVTTNGVESDFSQGFGNGFEKGNGAVGLDVDVHGDSVGSLSQLWFTTLGDTGTTANLPDLDAAEQTLTATFFTQALGVSVYREGRNFVDLTVGGRLSSVENELTVRSQGREVEIKDDRIWIDPTVGLNSAIYASESVLFRLGGDIGGFGVGSDLTWQSWASLGVKISKRAGIALGYRVMYHNYEDGDFLYDVSMKGPTLGFDFGF